LLCALGLSCLSSAARADFDATTGSVVLAQGDAFSLSFDEPEDVAAAGFSGADVFGDSVFDGAAVAARIHGESKNVIEGTGSLGLGGDMNYVTLYLQGLQALIGRRVEITVWQRPGTTRVVPTINWYSGDADSYAYLGAITFQPTGRATNDGWEEWSSGPFDWAWAEEIPPTSIDFIDENVNAAYGGAAYDADARTFIDALEIKDTGEAVVSAARCNLVNEHDVCGDVGLCHFGRCVDGAIRAGQPILDDALRSDYIDRRLFEVDLFEGGRAPQTRVDLVKDQLLPLKDKAVASTFWPTFTEAYTLLVDGHASAPMLSYPAFSNAGVCLHEGEADLLPGSPVTPLVFHTSTNVIGAQLQPGDALVAIDGVSVEEWAALSGRLVQHPGDPEGRSVVIAPMIWNAALDTGAVMTFHRCTPTTPGTPCTADQVQEIVLDFGAILGDELVEGRTVVGYDETAACDYRFVRPVTNGSSANNTDYEFAGHVDVDGVRTLVINGVPAGYDQAGDAWHDAIGRALNDAPDKLILDEREGDGGGIDAMDWLAAKLLDENDLYAMDFLPSFEDDELGPSRQAVVDCSVGGNGYFCGNGFRYFLGSNRNPQVGVAKDTKLAVVIGLDVSGNDYLTKLMRVRSGGETRVFGAGSTWGAFGVIWSIAGHMGELAGGSLQVQDTLFMSTENDDNADFPTSTGERPDEVVRQKQSDALVGKDTVLEAARAWLVGGA
jgi:hypothetical protein